MVAVSGLTYSISYSRILFSFRNGMCKIHSHFPCLVIFSFSSLIIQCFLFLGAGCITCGRWQIPASKNYTCFQKYNTLNILKHFSFAKVLYFVPLRKANLVLRGGLSRYVFKTIMYTINSKKYALCLLIFVVVAGFMVFVWYCLHFCVCWSLCPSCILALCTSPLGWLVLVLREDSCLEAVADKCWRDLLIQTVDTEVTDLPEWFSQWILLLELPDKCLLGSKVWFR